MNIVKSLTLLSILLLPIKNVHADSLKGCSAKKNEIENQLKYAKSHGNIYRVKGLEKALKENTLKCNDQTLRNEREVKVLEKERKVYEIEMVIKKENGNSEKVKKNQKKLKKAKEELIEAKKELNS